MPITLLMLLTSIFGGALFAATTPGLQSVKPDARWTYKKVDGKELKLDVFLPEGYEESEKDHPAYVVFHGGSWNAGEPNWHHPDCAYWSRRGMIAVSVDYRLRDRDQVEVPLTCVKDAKSAIRFLRGRAEQLKVDPDRIVVAGGSAGGQLAAATAVLEAPSTDDPADDLSVSCRPDAVILFNPFFKCAPSLSPPHHIRAGLPPMITFLGDQDPAISVDGLLDFHRSLKARGNASEYYVGKGGKHGFCNGRNPQNPFFYWSLELTDRFLIQHGLITGTPGKVRPPGVGILRTGTDFDAHR